MKRLAVFNLPKISIYGYFLTVLFFATYPNAVQECESPSETHSQILLDAFKVSASCKFCQEVTCRFPAQCSIQLFRSCMKNKPQQQQKMKKRGELKVKILCEKPLCSPRPLGLHLCVFVGSLLAATEADDHLPPQ